MKLLQTLFFGKLRTIKPENLFQKWIDICHIYTLHNLSSKDFNKDYKETKQYSFYVKWLNYPLSVKANCYLNARLKFWTAIRSKKQIKNLSYFHDRLIEKVEVNPIFSASLIGLSNVSTLQQKKQS